MAGQFLIKEQVRLNLRRWVAEATKDDDSWGDNDLHIDEIEMLKSVKRNQWVQSALSVFGILLEEPSLPDGFIFFLHLDLSGSNEEEIPKVVSVQWLEDNIDEFTPPSLMCASLEYYEDYYKVVPIRCDTDKSIADIIGREKGLCVFYRTFYDNLEKMYIRSVYIFLT